jgi:hypothetical protein
VSPLFQFSVVPRPLVGVSTHLLLLLLLRRLLLREGERKKASESTEEINDIVIDMRST